MEKEDWFKVFMLVMLGLTGGVLLLPFISIDDITDRMLDKH